MCAVGCLEKEQGAKIMDYSDTVIAGIKAGNQLSELLEKSPELLEALKQIKPVLPNKLLSPELAMVASLELNKTALENFLKMEGLDSIMRPLFGDMMAKIAEDNEFMGSRLVGLGYPDIRLDHENWRIIARMVDCDPDGFTDEIYEKALAKAATSKQEETYIEILKSVAAKKIGISVKTLNRRIADGTYDATILSKSTIRIHGKHLKKE